MSNWHSCFKVARIDVLARCINPIIKYPELKKEIILRNHLLKTITEYASFSIGPNLFVKDISLPSVGRLLFLSLSWITPNLCIVFFGFYNVESLERHNFINEMSDLLKNEEMEK